MNLNTCVDPNGYFIFSIHKPAFVVDNLRANDHIINLGQTKEGRMVLNQSNFPPENVVEENAAWIYEIPNPFPFRGTTYIGKRWADRNAKTPTTIGLTKPEAVSLTITLTKWLHSQDLAADPSPRIDALFGLMPRSVLLALAVTSTDADDLIRLANISAQFIFESDGITPKGMVFQEDSKGALKPAISDGKLFDAVANNAHLPEVYKKIMVLNPGIQGNSEIVGEWVSATKDSRVLEYLRRNSYIPWGHYAANMAHDTTRYRTEELLAKDIRGMRHLYYQRTYVRLAEQLGISRSFDKRSATVAELETLRETILADLIQNNRWDELKFNRTLWGWNFGFDFAASGYRLHASHQQVHQQFAMIPASICVDSQMCKDNKNPNAAAYACGDLITDFIKDYRNKHRVSFFNAYEKALRSNQRLDGETKRPHQLVIYEDDHILLFVPKAQTSQWELQLMPKTSIGNILETDRAMRAALDHAIWIAIRTLGAMNAKMITIIEFSKKIGLDPSDQRLLYCFLPRLPESPGAFSEAQLRWINGHYPEDFAAACRANLPLN
jgi:hypothetical protein